MIDLRDETIAALTKTGKSPEDISYIGDRDNAYSWAQLLRASLRCHQGNVILGFVIVFTDGSWLERGENGGWEYQHPVLGDHRNY